MLCSEYFKSNYGFKGLTNFSLILVWGKIVLSRIFVIEFYFYAIVITVVFKLAGNFNKVADLKACMNNETS